MGIVDLLLRLPGGAVYLQDFYELRMTDKEVPIDAAGLLWACAYNYAREIKRIRGASLCPETKSRSGTILTQESMY
jgi:hypothetical protein